METPSDHWQDVPTSDPAVSLASDLADSLRQPAQPGVSETVTQPSTDAAPDAPAVHTFQVTHKVASPENPENHSLVHSGELAVDEAIAWIRDRLLHS